MCWEAAAAEDTASTMRPDAIEAALTRFDVENRRDPRIATFNGQSYPREYLHAVRLHEWTLKLDPGASQELRLAARCNAIRRWEIPRETYPKTTAGYHKWRKALQAFHADAAAAVLKESGCDVAVIEKVRALVLMKNFPADPEARTLEDADCLTFLESKFHNYIGEWDEGKTVRILKGTLAKMSPRARELALGLPLSDAARALIQKAL